MPWAALQTMLARNGQMIALDPPFAASATVGGVIASNASGAMRKHFGTARDLVIGMQFAMLDGKLVRTGGMVVKNVAGLDIGKLLIGSFGTLAVITSVNFRLHSLPEETHTFLFSFADMADAIQKRDVVLRSVLRPVSIDCFTPTAAARLGHRGSVLAIRAAGTKRVLERYARELSGSEHLTGSADERLWAQVREFPANWLRENPEGLVLRVSTAISDVEKLLQLVSGAGVSRAAFRSDVCVSEFLDRGGLAVARCRREWLGSCSGICTGRDPAGALFVACSEGPERSGFCHDEECQTDFRSAKSAEPFPSVWPYLNRPKRPLKTTQAPRKQILTNACTVACV